MSYQAGDRIRDCDDHRATGTVAREQTSTTSVIVSWDDSDTSENPYAVPAWMIEPIPTTNQEGR